MRLRLSVMAILLLITAQAAFADSEFWSYNTLQFPLSKKSKLNVMEELRFKNNMGELYYIQTYIGPALYLSDNFELDLYYSFYSTETANIWANSSLTYLDAIYKFGILNNRFRFQYNITANSMKYRNRLQVKKFGFSLDDEIFYEFNNTYFSENRACLAYAVPIYKWLDLNVGGMLRSTKTSAAAQWSTISVLTAGVTMRI